MNEDLQHSRDGLQVVFLVIAIIFSSAAVKRPSQKSTQFLGLAVSPEGAHSTLVSLESQS